MNKNKKLDKCTWCNKKINSDSSSKEVKDAANIEHVFHTECWKEHVSWLREI